MKNAALRKNAALSGKPYAGNPHVRFEEGEVASAKPRRGSLLYKALSLASFAALAAGLAFGEAALDPDFAWSTGDVVIPADTIVEVTDIATVNACASLTIKAAPIRGLRVSASGAGTIDGFTFAAPTEERPCTLDVVDVPPGRRSSCREHTPIARVSPT